MESNPCLVHFVCLGTFLYLLHIDMQHAPMEMPFTLHSYVSVPVCPSSPLSSPRNRHETPGQVQELVEKSADPEVCFCTPGHVISHQPSPGRHADEFALLFAASDVNGRVGALAGLRRSCRRISIGISLATCRATSAPQWLVSMATSQACVSGVCSQLCLAHITRGHAVKLGCGWELRSKAN